MNTLLDKSKCLSLTQITGYLNDEIQKEHRFRIENHLLDCQLCSEALEGYANNYNPGDPSLTADVNEILRKTLEKKDALPVSKNRSLPSFNRIAATILMLILPLAAWLYWNSNSNDRLFNNYYQPVKNDAIIAMRGNAAVSAEIPLELSEALNAYDQKAYGKSLAIFESFLEKNPTHVVATFYAGIAALETGHHQKAINFLTTTRLNSDNYYEEASWNLALTYVKIENHEMAGKLLSDLLKVEKGRFEREARQLKADLGL